ncbi:MAG: gliding motility-associated C-terminal domain-containing protein, partial [Bacteroidia bacterium]
GSTIFFQYQLLNNYIPSGLVQLIRIPQYINTTVAAPLTCAPWNGSTGGVLVMEVSGTLTLNANIDVSGKGFRGGIACANPDGGCGSGYPDYYYPVSSGFGAEKGEGITAISSSKNGGRGALGNGGGGGNKHNSGGGGGGNYSSGGVGGDEANFCPPTPVGGVGGNPLNYFTGKIFLGGGGGCSDNNNGVGTLGSNGGGIIIIRANTIIGNNDSIISNGINVGSIPNGIGDGAGGAGAGGTVLLKVPTYTSNLYITANGGKGGDQITTYGSCFGPGGGGGTGVIYASTSSLPVNVITATQAGNSGIDLYSGSSCYMTSYGAANGQNATALKYNLVLPENTSLSSLSINLGNDTIICSNNPVTLNAFNPGANYSWSTGATTSSIVINSSGTYWVSVTSPLCSQTASDTINITYAAPVSLNLGNDTVFCGGTITLNASNPGATYLWSTGATSQTITTAAPGTYWVSVFSGSCPKVNDTINILTPTPVSSHFGNDTTVCGNSITLNASNQWATYLWSTGETSPAITINNPGTYWVNISGNCSLTGSDTIHVTGSATSDSIEIPNVITPNADNQNDYLTIGSQGGPELQWTIYNRWGEKIYSENGDQLTWNCFYKNTLLNAGTYFWTLTYISDCHDKKEITEKGFITVIH